MDVEGALCYILYHGGYKHLLQMKCWLVGTKEIGSGKKERRGVRRKTASLQTSTDR